MLPILSSEHRGQNSLLGTFAVCQQEDEPTSADFAKFQLINVRDEFKMNKT